MSTTSYTVLSSQILSIRCSPIGFVITLLLYSIVQLFTFHYGYNIYKLIYLHISLFISANENPVASDVQK